MDMRTVPARAGGTVKAIPSKSAAHRLLICAAVADGETKINLPETSADIDATISCLRAMGAGAERADGWVNITPAGLPAGVMPILDCGESGSTLRFLLPVAAVKCGRASFSGRGRLPERPIRPLLEQMEAHGAVLDSRTLPLTATAMRRGGDFRLPGDISSQFITGLLLAAPLLAEDTRVEIAGALESAGYVDMTIEAMGTFGVRVMKTEKGFLVPGGQRYISPGQVRVEGDWSAAAFFIAAGALTGSVTVTGLSMNSAQGDKKIVDILEDMGAEISIKAGGVLAEKSRLHGTVIDASGVPDLVPILAVCAGAALGETRIINAGRLRLKESDRLRSAGELLRSLGREAAETEDGLIIKGGAFSGGRVDGCGDHRIVMSAAIAGLLARGPVEIQGAEAADKSYPGFWKAYRETGGRADVVNLR